MPIKVGAKSGSVDLSQKMFKGDPGGYYTPDVDAEGNLTWVPSEEGMAPVEGDNIRGPAGRDGIDGAPGAKGDSGVWYGTETPPEGYDAWIDPSGQASESLATVGYVDEQIAQIELTPGPVGPAGKDGKDGSPGKDGEDGVTPVKGVDYWTEEDQTQIVNDVLNSLPAAEGVSV